MADPINDVSDAFDQLFRALVAELAGRHPEARLFAGSVPTGSGTAFQGHMVYVECSWPGRLPDEPDNVILEVQFCHLTTAPRVNADVSWGQGPVEAEFASGWSSSDEWPEATPIVLAQLSARMPELVDVFRRVVARGRPIERSENHYSPYPTR